MIFIGIDLGGTNAKAGAVRSNGDLLAKHEIQLVEKDVNSVVDTLVLCVHMALEKCVPRRYEKDIISIGIGSPGEVRDGYVIHAANFPGWSMVPLAVYISQKFGNLPTVLVNDADAAVISEWWIGAARTCNVRDFVMFTLGTGVGCGMVCNGSVVHGHSGLVEGGHMIMNPFGLRCTCSQRGCLETYASATSVVRRALQLTKRYYREYQREKRSRKQLAGMLSSLSCDIAPETITKFQPNLPHLNHLKSLQISLIPRALSFGYNIDQPQFFQKSISKQSLLMPHAHSETWNNEHIDVETPCTAEATSPVTPIPYNLIPDSFPETPSFTPLTLRSHHRFTFDPVISATLKKQQKRNTIRRLVTIMDPIAHKNNIPLSFNPNVPQSDQDKSVHDTKINEFQNEDGLNQTIRRRKTPSLKKPLLISKLLKSETEYAASRENNPDLKSADSSDSAHYKFNLYSQIGAHEVFEAAYKGDKASIQAIDEACEMLGLACVNISRLLDVELILFSGGMTHAGTYLFSRIRNAYAKYTWKSLPNNTKILPAQVGNDSGIIGAAGIGKNLFFGSFETEAIPIYPRTVLAIDPSLEEEASLARLDIEDKLIDQENTKVDEPLCF